MPTIQDLSTQLVGEVPGLPRLFAFKYINKALQEIRREKLWSWNVGDGVLISPDAVATGTVTTVQGSPSVTFNAAAQAVLSPLVIANPPLISRQFRVSGGPIYNILAYDTGTGVMTLDKTYGEGTGSGATYTIYKCYYGPCSTDGTTPNNDFLRYLSILNPVTGYVISGKRLYMQGSELNRRDPQRGGVGVPYYLATYAPGPLPTPPNSTTGTSYNVSTYGQMQYEMWPHPVSSTQFRCLYERLHVDLLGTDYIPATCPDTLVTYKANEYAYRWAMTNSARIPELKGVDWRMLLLESKTRYQQALVSAKRIDNEISVTILRPGQMGMLDLGPIDSNYMQSHGVGGI